MSTDDTRPIEPLDSTQPLPPAPVETPDENPAETPNETPDDAASDVPGDDPAQAPQEQTVEAQDDTLVTPVPVPAREPEPQPAPTSAPAVPVTAIASPAAPAARTAGTEQPVTPVTPVASADAASVTPEATRPRLRVATVVWGLVVAALGVGVLALASGAEIDAQLALIVLLTVAGVTLLVGSLVSSARASRR